MLLTLTLVAAATTPRWDFENAYDNNLPWYKGYNNESAGLAWGESYVLMALVTMFEATEDPIYLDRLDAHLEAVHAARDDQRGVSDYRGISGACWRDWYYQDEPYCYVGHSGMIAYGFAAYGAAVRESRLTNHHAPDGETYGEKADRYIGYAEEVVANHDDQWRDAGYYIFRSDADFLGYPGIDNPYNLSNAMGRVLVALWRATGNTSHLDKVEKIAAQLWDARAFYTGTAGATTDLEITLTSAEAAELGIVGESGAATVVRFGLYGVIAYEVYYTGSLLWEIWDYSADIADLEDEYIEASIELGMTEEEAVEEYYEDLYEENTYYDNFVDIYCIWCD